MNEGELFIAALQIEDPAERSAYLDQTCGGDAALRQRVEALLRAFAQAGSFLQRPAADASPTSGGPAAEPAATERPGVVLAGRYKLLEQVGEGGMGTVWMAQQTEPVRRLVAVKLIKPGMDSRQVLARFEQERQALALMDQPHIAKVLDAGVGPDGRPFFVMELVKGVPITTFCDERRLTPRQRLGLFVDVCQAIQHAHHKGVIHRDVKPSNVLVALYDDRPAVKVIDFGVAKAAGTPLTEWTLHTGFGAVVGTLEYMSPEQAGFNQLDVDARSDVYSLGVLLYELLAGSPPFGREELAKAGVLEALRVIREQEPPRPSTKLSTADGLPALAADRGTEPSRLTALLKGELDWVVMKALEKDRDRRYETASAFAQDVERFLRDEPVQACPPGAGYRLRKFARRNRAALSAAAVVSTALLLGIAVSTWQAARATWAEAQANVDRDEAVTARNQAREAQIEAMRRQREAEVNALGWGSQWAGHLVIEALYSLGVRSPEKDAGHAERLADEVITELQAARLRSLAGKGDEDTFLLEIAYAHGARGLALRQLRRDAEALEDLDRFLELARSYGPPDPDLLSLGEVYVARADVLNRLGRHLQAVESLERAFDRRGGVEPVGAEPLLLQCLGALQKKGPDHWARFLGMSLLGDSLLGRGEYAAAEPLLVQGYEGLKRRESEVPAGRDERLAGALRRLVKLYDAWGRKEEADRWRAKLAAPAGKDDTPGP